MVVGKIRILGIAGSLRKASFNKSILNAALELLPEGAEMEIFNIDRIPLFNQDLEADLPKPVAEFKARIRAANAILIATPEYNFSVPGVLKNAIDWGSRPDSDNSWKGKCVAIMSASNGMIGGERAQLHLRQSLVTLDMHQVNKPEVIVSSVAGKLDRDGKLVDAHTREKIRELLAALVLLAVRFRDG